MKHVFFAAIVLGLSVQGLLAASPDTTSGSQPTKQPWEWTDAERLAGRFDPAFLKAIRHIHHAPPPGLYGSDEGDTWRTGPIYGEINPELILPIEAFNYLLQNVRNDKPSVVSDHFRAILDARLVAFGYKDPSTFWNEFETVVHDHLELAHRTYDLNVRLQHATDSERQALQEKEGGKTCLNRIETLARARAHFGRDYFDRLLYTVAAPGVSPGVRPDFDDEYRAAWIESGCQSEAASLLVTAASTAAPARASGYWSRGAAPAKKAPWEWTDAERMTFRLDPSVIGVQTPTGTGGLRSQQLVGATHPEAIFPFELFDILLVTERGKTNDDERGNARLFAYGVTDTDAWWHELHAVVDSYAAPSRENHDVAAGLQRADRTERVALEKQLAELRRAQCRSTAQGLNAAREHYGREAFDRFLYTVVAPELTLIKWVDDDLTKELTYQARGCGSSTNSTFR